MVAVDFVTVVLRFEEEEAVDVTKGMAVASPSPPPPVLLGNDTGVAGKDKEERAAMTLLASGLTGSLSLQLLPYSSRKTFCTL